MMQIQREEYTTKIFIIQKGQSTRSLQLTSLWLEESIDSKFQTQRTVLPDQLEYANAE